MYVNFEGIIPACAGVWATLMAFGKIAAPAGVRDKPWWSTWIKFAKFGGPFLIVFGILQMFVRL